MCHPIMPGMKVVDRCFARIDRERHADLRVIDLSRGLRRIERLLLRIPDEALTCPRLFVGHSSYNVSLQCAPLFAKVGVIRPHFELKGGSWLKDRQSCGVASRRDVPWWTKQPQLSDIPHK